VNAAESGRKVSFRVRASIPNLVFSRPQVAACRRKMSMKFNKSSQLLLVSAASLLAASLVTACATLTVDFVFVTSSRAAGPNNYGEINVMEVDSESGNMRQIPTSPFPSGGRNPVAEAVSTDQSTLYVVNHDDNTIVQFAIGNDGKVYPQNTVNTPAVFPMAVAVAGSSLFVVDTYQPLPTCSPANPCSGAVAVLPIAANDSLGTPVSNSDLAYWPLTLPSSSDVMLPTAVNVVTSKSGTYVYVTAFDWTASGSANPAGTTSICNQTPSIYSGSLGYIFGFSVGSGGALSPLNGGVPFAAGTLPCAIASDPAGSYVYVTDSTNDNVRAYSVASGLLTPLSSGPFPTGNQPSAITIDPSGNYAFVANAVDSTISAYTISNGALTLFGAGTGSGTGTYATDVQPVAIIVDPSTSHFVYTANFLGATVSGYQLETGTSPASLLATQNTPYKVSAQPTAMVAITHGGTTAKQ
jgi:6-phosphogluconolactonase (cycloisomerase 2 family)